MSASRRGLSLIHTDFIVCVTVAAIATALTFADAAPVLRTAVAIPLVLLLPGYVLLDALFPTRILPAIERVLISIGASLCVTILAGLVIAALGVPLGPRSWVVALAAFVVVVATVGLARRVRRGIAGPGLPIAAIPRAGAVLFVVAALLAADVVLASRLIATEQQPAPPVQLWMVPVEGSPADAVIGVRADDDAGQYRVVISASGEPIFQFDLALKPDETWQRNVTFAAELRAVPIVARLYEGTSTAEIRFVVLQPASNGT
jgi:hypothetical protein